MIRLLLLISCLFLAQQPVVAQQTGIPEFGEGNAVSLKAYPLNQLLGYRWAPGVRIPSLLDEPSVIEDLDLVGLNP